MHTKSEILNMHSRFLEAFQEIRKAHTRTLDAFVMYRKMIEEQNEEQDDDRI